MQQADIIVIGSGQGGEPLAKAYAEQGKRAVLFERAAVGGTCVNSGCLPSKAFLASAHAAHHARTAGDLGIHAQVAVDFPAVMARARAIIEDTRRSVLQGIEEAGVQLVRGEASFANERMVTGGGVEVEAPLIVINTGASAFIPPIEGLSETAYTTYETFWELDKLPARTIVLGGGYIGLELGQGLARLGSKVTVIEQEDRLAAEEETDVSELVAEALPEEGPVLHIRGQAPGGTTRGNGSVCVEMDSGHSVEGDLLLVATGRRPNTKALRLEAAGVELDDQGYIRVDKHFRTTTPPIYAIGDVTGQPAFTHVAWEDYRRLQSILEGGDRTQGDRVLGYAFFIEPQVGRAGLTLEQARGQGYQARAATMPVTDVARAKLSGQTRGFYRVVIDERSDRILGATLVGAESAELIHILIAHMEAGANWQTLERSVYIHPEIGRASCRERV